MDEASQVEQAMNQLIAAGPVEVYENGQWLAVLSGLRFEVRHDGRKTLIHLWSEERNLVRRVLRIAEQTEGHIVLEVQRFGRTRPDRLEFVCADGAPSPVRLGREKFRDRFRQLLAEQFPDEQISSLTTSADLEHSLSGCFARGLLYRGKRGWAVLGASPAEGAATIDGILTYGLVWLGRARRQAEGRAVAGLRLFLPEGSSRVTAHRLAALGSSTHIELYELDATSRRSRPVDARDIGNLTTWLTPRREIESTLVEAAADIAKLRQLAPDDIQVGVPPGTREVTFRLRGVEWARWQRGKVLFGLGEQRRELNENNWGALEQLLRELDTFRHPLARDTTHPLYRMQAERWLESLVQADSTRIDARLDLRHVYSQVPAFAATDRGVIDLLGVTREGRLVVIELKATEDIHLVFQAVDYWLRVRWHQQQGDFHRYGYFTGLELQQKPPLLYLVAPGFCFHSTTDTLLEFLSPEVDVRRVGLNENWRRGLRVVFRK